MFVPFAGGTNIAAVTQEKHVSLSFTIEMKIFTLDLELRHIEINASSSSSTI